MASARGGHLSAGRSGPPSEAAKAVEALFETQTVVEIREVETKTRTDIEDKNKQLRLLVGSSYRDLISSADTILQMDTCCNKVLSNVIELQNGFSQLAGSVSDSKGSKEQQRQEGDKRKAMHAVGSRIKYLVDTPEMIWGALDTRAYLEAARRYLRASEVHRLLTQHAAAELRTRFPLVHRQWPQIQKFQGQILERVTQRLRSEVSLSAGEAATALAAGASLQQLTSVQVLELFLSARQHWLTSLLTAAANEAAMLSTDNLADVFAEVAQQLQEGVWQVGRLFLDGHSSEGKALLPATAADDSLSGGELLLGPLVTSTGAVEASEAAAWQAQNVATLARLRPLSQQEAAQACEQWLNSAAEDFARAGGGLLQGCRTMGELAAVEMSLRESVARWQHAADKDADAENTMLSPRHSLPNTPKASGRLEEGLPVSWEGVCDWVLGKRVPLWDVVFEAAFLQRSKELIEGAFAEMKTALEAPLQRCSEAARNSAPSVPGSYRTAQWPEDGSQDEPAKRKRARFDDSGRSSLAPQAAASRLDGGWRRLVASVQAEFDSRLRAALKDSLLLLAEQAPAKDTAARRGTYGRNFPLPPRKSTGRAAILEPFIQQQCAQATEEVARKLGSQLEALPPTSIEAKNSFAAVEEALLIGRLANALGSPDTLLPVILGPPDEWREAHYGKPDASFSGDLGRMARGRANASNQFAALQQQFREVAIQAHTQWAAWAAEGLGQELESSMANDAALVSNTALRTWEETIITQEDELGEGPMQTRFQLPSVPSPGAMMYLLAAGRELQRAGGAAAGSVALDLLENNLSSAALKAFGQALSSGTALERRISEKGVLQLLFDARFLHDALCGKAPPAGKGLGFGGGEAAERSSAFADLEASLQERLDPIDWAIYGSYLWANEAALFQRVRILYGSLVHHKRTAAEAPPKTAPSGEANIMSMAPAATRFAYLPISTPFVSATGLRQLPSTGVPQGGLEEQGPSNDYSFASLGGLRPGANLEREAESAATTAFEALQSRFTTQRLGAIGSLLGDRAAEVTAMAQQSFSDIGLPSAFASALGGSGSSATGLLASFRGFRGGTE